MSGFIIYSISTGNSIEYLSSAVEARQALADLQKFLMAGQEIILRKHKAQPIDTKAEVLKSLSDPNFKAITITTLDERKSMGFGRHYHESERQFAFKALKAIGFAWLDEPSD